METKPIITIEDFKKVDIAVGKILSAEKVPDTDKLLRLSVDMGEAASRQIISGISLYFPDPALLIGRKCIFVANLEPRMIRGFESQGMILAVSVDPASEGEQAKFSLLQLSEDIPPGTRAK